MEKFTRYRQTHIPEVKTPPEWRGAKTKFLIAQVKEYYLNNIQGTAVTNQDKGFRITFSGQGRQKITKGSYLYGRKAAVVLILKELLEVAEYSNFGHRKSNDPVVLMGYLNFKAKCRIDGKLETLRIACMMYEADKIYFNHEINKKP